MEGTEAGLVHNLKDECLLDQNPPKYITIYRNEEKINEPNQFYEEKNELGSEVRVFKMTDNEDNASVHFNAELGQVKLLIPETELKQSGNYKMVATNDAGDYDVATWTLNVARKFKRNQIWLLPKVVHVFFRGLEDIMARRFLLKMQEHSLLLLETGN